MSYRALAARFGPESTDFDRDVVQVVNGIMLGKTNNIGTITLAANQATTTVTVASGLIGESSVILFSPTTANAANEYGAGTLYVSARDVLNNQFTITHVNNAQTDRTFSYVFIG